jgi:hypothetical protein
MTRRLPRARFQQIERAGNVGVDEGQSAMSVEVRPVQGLAWKTA